MGRSKKNQSISSNMSSSIFLLKYWIPLPFNVQENISLRKFLKKTQCCHITWMMIQSDLLACVRIAHTKASTVRSTWCWTSKWGSRLSPRHRLTLLRPSWIEIDQKTRQFHNFQCYRSLHHCNHCRRRSTERGNTRSGQ